jgi:formylglycine-generating enzyme required for sulfatase activity
MLQAREHACILILAAFAGLASDAPAGQDDPANSDLASGRPGAIAVPEETPQDTGDPAGEAGQQDIRVEEALAAGRLAFAEGRVDQPPGDCAWFYFSRALDLDPASEAAADGLRAVQEDMIERALEFARELDFESAERMLEEALLVNQERTAVQAAEERIRRIRIEHADQLEAEVVRAMDAGDFRRAERLLIDLIALGDRDTAVSQLRRRVEEARVYGGFKPGQVIRDPFPGSEIFAPELVIIAAGSFVMGSPASERGREDWEGPEHRVTFRRGFALGRTEVTVGEFRAFSNRTGFRTVAEKDGHSIVYDHHSGRLMKRDGVTWEMNYEGREARDDEPVVHVSWHDAVAFTAWLAQGTGKAYRLPSEAEFEYALRSGNRGRYWWGDGAPQRTVENLTGERDVSPSERQWSTYFEGYLDRFWGPAPVATFEANPFGLHDIGGNVAEWVMDCWHDTYLRAPADGAAWINPGCKLRVVRGGYWASSPDHSRSAFRISAFPERHDARIGFRIARDL